MTAKPIFIVRLSRRYFNGEERMYMKALDDLRATLTDYHVLLTGDSSSSQVEFECYNAANATEKDIQEIQDLILKKLEDGQVG